MATRFPQWSSSRQTSLLPRIPHALRRKPLRPSAASPGALLRPRLAGFLRDPVRRLLRRHELVLARAETAARVERRLDQIASVELGMGGRLKGVVAAASGWRLRERSREPAQ